MKVSIDFDGTLSRNHVQNFTKRLVDDGVEVWVVTSRHSDESARIRAWWWIIDQNKNLFKVAEECGIKKDNIIFTNGDDKINILQGKNFLFHLDDDVDELILILGSEDKCKPLNVNHSDWEVNCLEVLNKKP